jgi:hypothetical protein
MVVASNECKLFSAFTIIESPLQTWIAGPVNGGWLIKKQNNKYSTRQYITWQNTVYCFYWSSKSICWYAMRFETIFWIFCAIKTVSIQYGIPFDFKIVCAFHGLSLFTVAVTWMVSVIFFFGILNKNLFERSWEVLNCNCVWPYFQAIAQLI